MKLSLTTTRASTLLLSATLLLSPVVLSSCAPPQTDPAYAGAQYCACMKENGALQDFGLAYTICDAEMVKKFRYYRILFYYGKVKSYDNRVTDQARDSAGIFMVDFSKYVAAHCCEESPPCPAQE